MLFAWSTSGGSEQSKVADKHGRNLVGDACPPTFSDGGT